MSKSEVSAVDQFGPYSDVRSTGGVETPNAIWDGRKTNISFDFKDDALVKVQIWAYEGKDLERALDAWVRVAVFLQSNFGSINIQGIPAPSASTEDATIRESMRKMLSESTNDSVFRVQMGPQMMPAGAIVYCSLFRHPDYGYYVFLYYTKPAGDK